MRTIIYTIISLVVLNFVFPYFIPFDTVYHNRLEYKYGQYNIQNIDVALKKIKAEIRREKLTNYGIILGDSVIYGSPGSSDHVVNAYMEEEARRLTGDPKYRIFNLSYPANQNGDIYVMLLKLDKLGISTDNLIINTRYANFVPRNPGPRAVFWLYDDLRKLERSSYDKVLPQLMQDYVKPPVTMYEKTKHWLKQDVMPILTPYANRDFFRKLMGDTGLRLLNKPIPSDALADSLPYFEKPNLQEYVTRDEIKKAYTDTPFDMTSNSFDIYFMDKIIDHQKNKKTLIVLTGANQTLLKDYIDKPGYKANMESLNQYFQSKPVQYVNLEGVISDSLFTDHTHMMPEGYRELAGILLQNYPK
ncbi:hypothetical protein [Paenibacillus eucommiae]|uniref:SGNH/GDSL hydrolase family protein n=1 Tax=Paenibacillus eucommiae TaxID=1355755 RepID=A0ABS4JAY0_9BACL|nr:hypothetical protein [Paenibacillus eucommiae]MBP1996993.1 hypothetical protein [Paenibacillus eucommiae]